MVSGKRTRVLRLIGGGLALTLVGAALTSCAAGSGAETIRFTFSKREAIEFMTERVAQYNASQDDVKVEIENEPKPALIAEWIGAGFL